MSKGQRSDMVM